MWTTTYFNGLYFLVLNQQKNYSASTNFSNSVPFLIWNMNDFVPPTNIESEERILGGIRQPLVELSIYLLQKPFILVLTQLFIEQL